MSSAFCDYELDISDSYYYWVPAEVDNDSIYRVPSEGKDDYDPEEATIGRDNNRLCFGTPSPDTEAVSMVLEQIEEFYDVSDPDVKPFLLQNIDVQCALERAILLIFSVFGETAKAELEIAPGFEGSPDDRIVCSVNSGDGIDTSLEKLSAFGREWRTRPITARNKLSFNIKVD
jgi:hypothetical protein